ncbi:hypothetical protein T06_16470 [Trichinella sp. T6]|nr:hypothetical protein T06_16470 [Trichinella sp. T6]
MSTIPRLINPLMDCWGRAHPREFLFGLQKIVKSKYTLLDCWGGPHLTIEKNVSKNSVYDDIKFFLRVDLVL